MSPTLTKRQTQFLHSWMPLYLEKRGLATGASSRMTASLSAPDPGGGAIFAPRYSAAHRVILASRVLIDPTAGGAAGFEGFLAVSYTHLTLPTILRV